MKKETKRIIKEIKKNFQKLWLYKVIARAVRLIRRIIK
jgi:hypothetical protein